MRRYGIGTKSAAVSLTALVALAAGCGTDPDDPEDGSGGGSVTSNEPDEVEEIPLDVSAAEKDPQPTSFSDSVAVVHGRGDAQSVVEITPVSVEEIDAATVEGAEEGHAYFAVWYEVAYVNGTAYPNGFATPPSVAIKAGDTLADAPWGFVIGDKAEGCEAFSQEPFGVGSTVELCSVYHQDRGEEPGAIIYSDALREDGETFAWPVD